MTRRLIRAGLGMLLLVGAGSGCSSRQRAGAETAVAKVLISDQQEVQIGQQVKTELEQKQGLRYVQDAEVTNYVKSLTQPVLSAASRDRKGVKWQVHVIDDPKTVNAFATPGGFLYVYTGLILAADNEAELVGVMAHEAGHVVGRHSARQMVGALGLQTVAAMALGQNPGMVAQVATAVAGNGAMLAHGRSSETEADEYGARYARAAGFDPHGLVTFFQKLQKQEGKTPGVLKWLSTHPTSAERVEHLNEYIREKKLSGGQLGGERLAAMKAKLQR